jgi:UDP-N-acetylglucosamine--N-acetylmuramyl-(pentapeptide) pyrophosphoryl-undecaprenol N-acetylglucosamine transferase
MNRKYIVSGGGTGGHIFPALAIANEIRRRDPEASILFVGALGRMEMERVPSSGFPIIGLPVEGFKRKIGFGNLAVVVKLLFSMFKASKIIRSFKPDVVIGVGGYASGPLLRMAAYHKIPSLIQEQNSYAGITNRLLAHKAKKICVAYEGMQQYFPADKIVLTGNPIREEIVTHKIKKNSACSFFGIPEDKPVVLILGGSLGARTINESILSQINAIEKENISVLWQTGKLYIDQIKKELDSKQLKNIRYFDFISRMDMAYSAANIIISRAGAATISELCLLGKPSILVPSPNVAEDHQTKNAMALVKNEAAIMVKDSDAREKLFLVTLDLLHSEPLQEKLGDNCRKMALPGSTTMIVDEIYKLAKAK